MLCYNCYNCDHPFNNLLSGYKVSSELLRNSSIVKPSVNTGRLKKIAFLTDYFLSIT